MPKKQEPDSVFALKVIVFLILGGLWLRLDNYSIPVGLVIGVFFAAHDHFQIDRKIEYVVLLLATVLSFFLPTGIIV